MLYLVLSKMKSIQMSNTKEPYLTNVSSPARDATIGSFQLFPQMLQNMSSYHGTQTMSTCQLEDLPMPSISIYRKSQQRYTRNLGIMIGNLQAEREMLRRCSIHLIIKVE
jgi:hypothetical protein